MLYRTINQDAKETQFQVFRTLYRRTGGTCQYVSGLRAWLFTCHQMQGALENAQEVTGSGSLWTRCLVYRGLLQVLSSWRSLGMTNVIGLIPFLFLVADIHLIKSILQSVASGHRGCKATEGAWWVAKLTCEPSETTRRKGLCPRDFWLSKEMCNMDCFFAKAETWFCW